MSPLPPPNSRIAYNPSGLDAYKDLRHASGFVPPAGNLASALGLTFTFVDPVLHDGNCAVNSFLMGVNGVDAYAGKDGLEKLRADIREFRTKIVSYAEAHRDELAQKYSPDEVSQLIRLYNDATQRDWTENIEWECAASVYKCIISLYSTEGKSFAIDENRAVAPSVVFTPRDPPEKPPVKLMWYGRVHYCLLKPR